MKLFFVHQDDIEGTNWDAIVIAETPEQAVSLSHQHYGIDNVQDLDASPVVFTIPGGADLSQTAPGVIAWDDMPSVEVQP